MIRKSLFLVACLSLAACATSQMTTAAQTAEKSLIEANNLYVAIATTLNAYEALPTASASSKTAANAVEVKAYSDLLIARQAYAAGQVIDLSILAADQAFAKTAAGQ